MTREPPTEVSLTVQDGATTSDFISTDASIVIGRDPDCAVVVKGKGTISRRHCVIARRNRGSYTVVDLGSKSGTFLNGEQITRADLSDGDTIRLGRSVTILFDLLAADVAAPAEDQPKPVETLVDPPAHAAPTKAAPAVRSATRGAPPRRQAAPSFSCHHCSEVLYYPQGYESEPVRCPKCGRQSTPSDAHRSPAVTAGAPTRGSERGAKANAQRSKPRRSRREHREPLGRERSRSRRAGREADRPRHNGQNYIPLIAGGLFAVLAVAGAVLYSASNKWGRTPQKDARAESKRRDKNEQLVHRARMYAGYFGEPSGKQILSLLVPDEARRDTPANVDPRKLHGSRVRYRSYSFLDGGNIARVEYDVTVMGQESKATDWSRIWVYLLPEKQWYLSRYQHATARAVYCTSKRQKSDQERRLIGQIIQYQVAMFERGKEGAKHKERAAQLMDSYRRAPRGERDWIEKQHNEALYRAATAWKSALEASNEQHAVAMRLRILKGWTELPGPDNRAALASVEKLLRDTESKSGDAPDLSYRPCRPCKGSGKVEVSREEIRRQIAQRQRDLMRRGMSGESGTYVAPPVETHKTCPDCRGSGEVRSRHR